MTDIIDSFEQNTDDWLKARIGSVGGSGINFAVTNGKGRQDYLETMVAEIVSKTPAPEKNLWQFKRGKLYEPHARIYYQMCRLVKVRQISFARLNEFKHYSADGLVDEDEDGLGFIEIKIREPKTFLQVRKGINLPTNERRQISWGFRVFDGERKWCDHIDYCPEMINGGMISPMIVKRFYPDQKEISELDAGCDEFIKQMLLELRKVKGA